MEPTNIEGFLLIDKPKGVSSYWCVHRIKKILPKNIKIGHTGTLDTFATGLLILCIGRNATKLTNTLMGLDKQYIVTAKLGESSNTLDCTGTKLAEHNTCSITSNDIKLTMNKLGTSYEQIPPIYSALKHQGTPLYKLARSNKIDKTILEKIVKEKKRTVTLSKLELIDFSSPFFTFLAHVSKGTYIRSLAYDIAAKLDTVATTYELRRTHIGNLSVNFGNLIDEFKKETDIQNKFISIDEMKSMIMTAK